PKKDSHWQTITEVFSKNFSEDYDVKQIRSKYASIGTAWRVFNKLKMWKTGLGWQDNPPNVVMTDEQWTEWIGTGTNDKYKCRQLKGVKCFAGSSAEGKKSHVTGKPHTTLRNSASHEESPSDAESVDISEASDEVVLDEQQTGPVAPASATSVPVKQLAPTSRRASTPAPSNKRPFTPDPMEAVLLSATVVLGSIATSF
ncbi:hypothetical protein HDU93_001328, partial [Gonapodya sp. JEL0774]